MIGKLFDKATKYLQIKLDVLKLNAIQRVAVVMGFCMFLMLSMMLASAIMLFLGIALSEYFGALTGSTSAGYFIVTGIYVVLLLFIVLFKKKFQRWFAGLFISLLTTDDDDDDDNAPKP